MNIHTLVVWKNKRRGGISCGTYVKFVDMFIMEVFKKSGVTMWECRNCGHVVVGLEAPEVCPVCKHPQAYFEVRKENY